MADQENPTGPALPNGDPNEIPMTEQQQQQAYEAAYREQLQRRSCPGCGEEPFV